MSAESSRPFAAQPRLAREHRTIEAMIHVYCQRKHETRKALCPECQELLDYATARLEKCPFGEEKSTCANCTVHCYRPDMRERVRVVMRYAGPHMIYRHPYLAFMHLAIDDRRPAADLPKATKEVARITNEGEGV